MSSGSAEHRLLLPRDRSATRTFEDSRPFSRHENRSPCSYFSFRSTGRDRTRPIRPALFRQTVFALAPDAPMYSVTVTSLPVQGALPP
jgi:hypothetical protein